MHITRRSFASAAAASTGLLTTGISPLRAAGFPERDITLIVPWAAGGGTDALGREQTRLQAVETALKSSIAEVRRAMVKVDDVLARVAGKAAAPVSEAAASSSQ